MSGTPGPWEAGEFREMGGYDCMTAGVRAGPANLDGADYGQQRCIDMEPDAQARMMADARLIAAAPELAEALQEVMECFGPGTMTDSTYEKACNALAKARGQ
jgi:hypothetical protein